MTGPHTPCSALFDLARELRPKPITPVPYGFIANIHTAFMQKVFDISQWKRKSHIKHNYELDDLRTGFEIAEGYRIGHGLEASFHSNVGDGGLFLQRPFRCLLCSIISKGPIQDASMPLGMALIKVVQWGQRHYRNDQSTPACNGSANPRFLRPGYAGFPIYKPLVWFLAMQPLFFIFAQRPTRRTPKAKNFTRSWSNGRDVTVAYIC